MTAPNPSPPPLPASLADPSVAPARPSTRLVALVAAAVLAIAALGYWRTGMPDYAERTQLVEQQAQAQAASAAGTDVQQLQAMAVRLEEHLKGKPEDSEGWFMLGRAQSMLGRADAALAAYRRALALRGDDPRLLTDIAEVLGITKGHQLSGEPTELLAKALALDPKAPKTLALSGAAAFDRKDYAQAVKHWETLLKVSAADAGFVAQVRDGIAEARRLGQLPAPAEAARATIGAASIMGSVDLAPALKGQAAPDDTVFIFARAAEGPRMPLALLRKQVKDLPVSFTLDDSMAMSPAMKLSAFSRVVVVARISKSGQATPQPGDLSGESAPVALGAQGVRVEVREVVGK